MSGWSDGGHFLQIITQEIRGPCVLIRKDRYETQVFHFAWVRAHAGRFGVAFAGRDDSLAGDAVQIIGCDC